MRAAFGVITGDGNFVTRQRIHQFFHLLGRFFDIFALRIALNQLGKRLIGLAVGFRVAVGPVLGSQLVQERFVFVKQNQTLQIKGIIHIRMLRMQALEAFDRRQCFFALLVLIVGIGRVQLSLLRITPLRETRFQKFI